MRDAPRSDVLTKPAPAPAPGVVAASCTAAEEALARGATALETHGDLGRAREHFVAAATEALAAGDDELLGRAALGWSGLWVHENRGVVDATRVRTWRARAADRLPPTARTARRLAIRDAAEADYVDGTVQRVHRVLADARQSADLVLLGEALNLTHHCMLGPEHADARLLLAGELVSLGATEGRRLDLLMGMVWQTVDLVLAGDPHADRALLELERLASEPEHLATLYLVSAIRVMQVMRSGRLEEAETLAAACFELGERVGDADALGWYGAQMCAIRWYQRRTAELVPLIAELVSSPTLASTNDAYLAAYAVAAAAGGEEEEATRALRRLRGDGLAGLRSSSTWMVALLGAAIAAYALGDQEVAVEVRQLLAPYADLPVVASLGVACFGSAHYALGLAALTLADTEAAQHHLEAAVRHNRRLGNLPATRMAEDLLASTTGTVSPATALRCERHDSGWRIGFGQRTALVGDCTGMRYLDALLRSPGAEISAIALVGGEGEGGEAQPVLDARAVAEYRRRLAQLQEEMADAAGDEARLDRAQREYDALVDVLARSHGLSGRSRSFAGPGERARTSVQKAIKRAVTRIRVEDPVVADVVERHVVTGFLCSYRR
jgi:hypothetical protein